MMADILIRMEMPKTCADCHDADLPTAIAWLGAKCPWANGIIDPGVYDLRHDRHPNCPLQELPEHGDLISKPALFDEVFKVWGVEYAESDCNMLMDLINDAPVIVPADKEAIDAD